MNVKALSPRTLIVVAVVLTLVVSAALVGFSGPAQRTATVYFPEAKGLYVGDDVVVMGVPIGKVAAVTPQPDRVRVEVSYDGEYQIPADATVVLAAPSLVTVRQVVFTPPYTGGPALADGAEIPASRTKIPVEWDEIKKQLNQLASGLGPKGANAKGALNQLLKTTAANLDGLGESISQTVRALSKATLTLSENSGDLFGTVRNLDVFISALAGSDRQVAEFNRRLATVAEALSGSRDELGTALRSITRALTDLQKFLKDNRKELSGAVADLQPLTSMLAGSRQRLADALHLAPHALSNLYNIYDPISGAATGTLSAANMQAPGSMICTAIFNLGGSPDDCRQAVAPLAELLTSDPPPIGISPLERNGRDNSRPAPGGPGARSSSDADGLAGLLIPGGTR